MGRVFISYRRQDSAYPAGWLYDRLSEQLGSAQIFKDVDNLEPGDDFVDKITLAVSSCDVLLALIGTEWDVITDASGRRRLEDPDDFVRLEIEVALSRKIRVVPLLVEGASMPRPEHLPATLLPLLRRHAFELTPGHFNRDADELVTLLRKVLAEATAVMPVIVEEPGVPRVEPLPIDEPTPRVARPELQIAVPEQAADVPGAPEVDATTPLQPTAQIVDDTAGRPWYRPSPAQAAPQIALGTGAVSDLSAHDAGTGGIAPSVGSRNRHRRTRQRLARFWWWLRRRPRRVLGLVLVLLLVIASGVATAVLLNRPDLPRSAQPLPDDVIVWRRERDHVWNIATVTADGHSEVKLTFAGQADSGAVLTPDRRTVIYRHRLANKDTELRAVSADGREDQGLFTISAAKCSTVGRPAVNQDGLVALICGSSRADWRLLLLDRHGRTLRQLDQNGVGTPTFCRDGQWVVYGANRSIDGTDEGVLFGVPVAGGTPTQLTKGLGGGDDEPACAPGNNEVAYRHRVGDVSYLRALALDPGAPPRSREVLNAGTDTIDNPSWSPDGSEIVYIRGRGADADLWVVSVRDGSTHQVLDNPGDDGAPAWTAR
ncbi:MAG TPA: TIR domain-containing protein [Mycobacterium sp.]